MFLARYLEALVDLQTASLVASQKKRSGFIAQVEEIQSPIGRSSAASPAAKKSRNYDDTDSEISSMETPTSPFRPVESRRSQCTDLYNLEPYIGFFDADSEICRLFNAHKEYVSFALEDEVTVIWPQELVEYLNIRTTLREFERPILHLLAADGRQATCSLNGIGSAWNEYTEFLDIFYAAGSRFCLTDATYTLDSLALKRFPYLLDNLQIPALNHDRRQRAQRYLANPAPYMEDVSESNGSQGRKYQELVATRGLNQEPAKYFYCPYYPIRDLLETQETSSEASRTPRMPGITVTYGRSNRIVRKSQLVLKSAFGRDYTEPFSRNQQRLVDFQSLQGGRKCKLMVNKYKMPHIVCSSRRGSRRGSRQGSRRGSLRGSRRSASWRSRRRAT